MDWPKSARALVSLVLVAMVIGAAPVSALQIVHASTTAQASANCQEEGSVKILSWEGSVTQEGSTDPSVPANWVDDYRLWYHYHDNYGAVETWEDEDTINVNSDSYSETHSVSESRWGPIYRTQQDKANFVDVQVDGSLTGTVASSKLLTIQGSDSDAAAASDRCLPWTWEPNDPSLGVPPPPGLEICDMLPRLVGCGGPGSGICDGLVSTQSSSASFDCGKVGDFIRESLEDFELPQWCEATSVNVGAAGFDTRVLCHVM